MTFKDIPEEQFKLLAWHLIDTSKGLGFTVEEFQRAIAFLYGWSCYDASDNFKKVMSALVEYGMHNYLRKY